MDAIELIETALATGAAAGVSGAASSAVKDAYETLKAKVKRLLAGRPMSELTALEVDDDLIAHAQGLIKLADPRDLPAGNRVVVHGGNVQVGHHNHQCNTTNITFGANTAGPPEMKAMSLDSNPPPGRLPSPFSVSSKGRNVFDPPPRQRNKPMPWELGASPERVDSKAAQEADAD